MRQSASILRTFVIGLVGLAAVLWYGAARFTILGASELDEEERVARLRGRVLRWACETLGATFIKLGQVMSTRFDLFPPAMITELKLLQDRLPAFPDARAIIERELGRPIGEMFAELDAEPIAAASVAQVHHGVLPDGTEVAVKVLRPDVRARAEGDAEILLFFARLAMRLDGRARHAELEGHLRHFVDGILEQTDLRIEASNYEKFRRNFKRVKKVRFPRVFPELSGERVMTMEFIRGDKVSASLRDRFPDLASRLREVFLKMCFDDGLLHADLHPGNFLVADDGTITIFDVGLTKELGEELLVHYIDFNRCLVMGDVNDFMSHLRRFHTYVEGTVDWAELEADMTRFNEEYRQRSAAQLEFGDLINRIFAVGRKHSVRPVPDMTLMMVGLITAEGIGKMLDPDVNSFQEVSNYLLPVLARRNMLSDTLLQAASAMSERALGGSAE